MMCRRVLKEIEGKEKIEGINSRRLSVVEIQEDWLELQP